MRFARRAGDQRVMAIAERAAAPLRVVIRGRPGVGRGTVARALDRAGSVRVAENAADLHDVDVDVDVYAVAEVVKPEDVAVVSPGPALVVLNKADLTGFGGDGPISAASARCSEFSAVTGVPVLPMSGLLAVAALDDLDATCWAALRALAAAPGGAGCLDGSFDGFLTARLPVQVAVRRQLLAVLDLFGIALAIAALRHGNGPAQVRALLRRVSGVDAVIDRIVAAGAPARYRRALDAVAELEALAVTQTAAAPAIGAFLACDDTVIARMAAALDSARARGLEPGPTPPLQRAVHWQRYSRAAASDLHRACGADITRGSLRLWSRLSQESR